MNTTPFCAASSASVSDLSRQRDTLLDPLLVRASTMKKSGGTDEQALRRCLTVLACLYAADHHARSCRASRC